MSLPVSSFNAIDSSANKIRHTYVKGFVDISGGDLNLQNGALNMYNGQNSVYFRVYDNHFTVTSFPSLQRVDVSLSSLIYLNTISGNVDDSFSTINQRITGITYDLAFDRTIIDNSISANGNALFNMDISVNGNALLYGDVSVNGNLYSKRNATFDGNVSFKNYLPTYNGVASPGNTSLVTKSYVDNALQTGGGSVLLVSNNTWSGNNNFSNFLPVWSGVGGPTQGNQFATKSYVDTNGGTILLGANNTWTGNNTFANTLPTWTGAGGPTQGNQFATKSYVDTNGSTLLLSSNNLFSGNNTFGGDVSMNKTLTVSGDVSFNGNVHVGGVIFQQVPALGFDGGTPGMSFILGPKLDAGGVA